MPVAVILNDHALALESNGDKIGNWNLADVSAVRTTTDQFAITFGSEDMIFEAEDVLRFSYEALPHIDGSRTRSGVLTKIRTVLAPPTPMPTSAIDLREERHLEVIAADPEPASQAYPTASGSEHCRGTRKDGQPCRSGIVLDSGFCSAHEPGRPQRSPRPVPVEDPSLASVFRQLERAVRDVRAGRMSPDTALALAGLAQAMCATIDADELKLGRQASEPAYLRRAT
jgi:hypothetical protein